MTRAFLAAAPAAASGINLEAANMGVGGIGITAILGYAVVFFGLVLLMAVIAVFGKIMKNEKKPAAAPTPAATPAPAATSAPSAPAGCVLENVDEKTAAMIMAIVADETQIPLNQLRFISIKEV